MSGPTLAERRAWLNTVMTSVVNALGMTVGIAIDSTVPTMPLWPSLTCVAIGCLSLVFLWLVRKKPSVHAMAVLYLVNSLAIVHAFYVSNTHFSEFGARWVPFQGDKLGVFVAAMVAPTLASGLASILAYTAVSIVQFEMFRPEIKAQIAAGEPWAMIAFGVASSILLISRFARVKLERRVAVAESRKEALERSAAKFQSIKDLMNTPLQTLEFTTSILAARQTHDVQVLAQIDRAVVALKEINEMLSRFEAESARDSSTPLLAFDAREVLNELPYR